MASLITQIHTTRNKEMEAKGTRPGYYLKKGDSFYFVSVDVNEPALNKICDKVLSDAKGWDYWVDFSFGETIDGRPAWANMDYTDRFI